jgi:hypothetical protein
MTWLNRKRHLHSPQAETCRSIPTIVRVI